MVLLVFNKKRVLEVCEQDEAEIIEFCQSDHEVQIDDQLLTFSFVQNLPLTGPVKLRGRDTVFGAKLTRSLRDD